MPRRRYALTPLRRYGFSPTSQDQRFAHWAALCSIFFLLNFFLLTLSAFFAGFVDATVGGGGLVQLPALFAILPAQSPPQLLGTNKLAAITGTINASIAFCRRVTLPVRFMILTCLAAGIGSLIGAQVTRFISPELFKLGLPVLLLGLLIYTLKHKRLGDLSAAGPFGPKAIVQGCLIGAGIGFYDGFIGPGTGTLLNLPIYPGVSVRFSARVRRGEVGQCEHQPWRDPLIWIYRKHIVARSDPDGGRQRRRRDSRGSIRALEREHLCSKVLCHRSLHSAGENGVGWME